MKTANKTVIPWSSLARLAGPLLIWLSLSYLLVSYLVTTEFYINTITEETEPNTSALMISAIISAALGTILTFWGYAKERIDNVPAVIADKRILCTRCGNELLSTTAICPYCRNIIGSDREQIVEKDMEEHL